jgi:hypothetical protein
MVGVLVATLLPTSAFAADPPTPAPTEATAPATPIAAVSKAAAAPAKGEKAPPAEPLPEPAVRLWVVAPSAHGPWTVRLDNEDAKPIRVPADVRLLRFEIEPEPFLAPSEDVDPKAKKKWAPAKKAPKPVVCKIPAPLRPEGFPEPSALLLRPGESYMESFDPRLFCFGKDAAAKLTGGAVVHVRFGWEAAKKSAWAPAKKPDGGPFAVEGTAFPPVVAPLRELTAPTMVLHFDRAPTPIAPATPATPATPEVAAPPEKSAKDATAKDHDASDTLGAKAAPAPAPPVVDENAPRLELTTSPFVDASSTSRASVTLTATNVGKRPMLVAIEQRMVAFRIDGPDGVLRCSAMPATHGVPRELYRTLKPGASSSMTMLLGEGCTRDALRRPGLYRVLATLNSNESGAELGLAAYTGTARAREPSLVRVLSGPDPFYAVAPRAVPTPKPPVAPEGDDESE